MTIIHISVCDPGESRVGAFQWSVDPDVALKSFREFRGADSCTSLWYSVTVPEGLDRSDITDWIDRYYWDEPERRGEVWGEPVKVYDRLSQGCGSAAASLTTSSTRR